MAINADTELSAAELNELLDIANAMIPENGKLGMPGAGDPAIMADIVKSIGRDLPLIREALTAIAAKSDGRFAELDIDRREALINHYYSGGGAPAAMLGRVILGAYYRDDRVLLALGMEARAPFPKGYVVEQGDWSLLETVRHRKPFWRDDRASAGEC